MQLTTLLNQMRWGEPRNSLLTWEMREESYTHPDNKKRQRFIVTHIRHKKRKRKAVVIISEPEEPGAPITKAIRHIITTLKSRSYRNYEQLTEVMFVEHFPAKHPNQKEPTQEATYDRVIIKDGGVVEWERMDAAVLIKKIQSL